ncbi:hypothetical protein [Clostridium ihumii]|uniref:hypothetical protein n=1 Tax=Clostridium ihumii TaxID=1470356 RepID=UPI00058C6266|nr:hypothetical protein [Clostridium ihumii]
MSRGLSTADIIKLKENDKEKVEEFYKFSSWTDDDYKEYDILLKQLKYSYGKCKDDCKEKIVTKSKGDALEDIVNFIIERSYFLEVYPNKRTSTNEIDQLIVISDYGKQSIYSQGFSRELLQFRGDFFLGECKNYDDSVGVTWVGKFNTLLKVCGDCKFGIIFSYKGLTGSENKWEAAHGLTKVIYKVSDEGDKKYILDFNINDFKKLNNKDTNFFKMIKAKKLALSTACKSEALYYDCDEKEELETIYKEMINGR